MDSALQQLPMPAVDVSQYHNLSPDEVIEATDGLLVLSTQGDAIYLAASLGSRETFHVYRAGEHKFVLLARKSYVTHCTESYGDYVDDGIRATEWDEGRRRNLMKKTNNT